MSADQPPAPAPTPNVSETPTQWNVARIVVAHDCNHGQIHNVSILIWQLEAFQRDSEANLRAQLAAVTKERDEARTWEKAWAKSANEADDRLKIALVQLTAALARAEKAEEDTRRLDWLERQFGLAIWRGVMIDDNKPVFDIHEPREEGWDDALGEELGSGRTLRAAIDAAITPTKEPTP